MNNQAKPLRIIHILNHVRETGNGIVNVTIDLACAQASLGHQVSVISEGGKFTNLLTEYGVEHFTVPMKLRPLSALKAFTSIAKIIWEKKPDIFHAHMMAGLCYGKLFRHVHPHKFSLFATVHNEWQPHSILMKYADKIICVSDAVMHSMKARGASKDKLFSVCNGSLNSPRKSKKSTTRMPELKKPAIITVAGMYERKGIRDVIDAFTLTRKAGLEANLYILGEGPDRAAFEKHAAQSLFHNDITFLGFRSNAEDYMRAADIFVLASKKDPCPLVVAEAREAGCACVVTNTDGLPELVANGQSGILVPVSNHNELSAALNRLLADPQLLAEYRNRAQQGLPFFSVQRMAEQTNLIYRVAESEKKAICFHCGKPRETNSYFCRKCEDQQSQLITPT